MVRTISLPPPAVLHTPKPPMPVAAHSGPDFTEPRPDSWECQSPPKHFVTPSSARDCPLPPLPRSLGLRNFNDLYPEPDSPCTPHDSLESLLRLTSLHHDNDTIDSEEPEYTPMLVPQDECGGRGGGCGGRLKLHLSGSDFMRPFTPSFLFSTMFPEDSPEGYVFRDSPLESIEDNVDADSSQTSSLLMDRDDDDRRSDIISSSCTLLGDGWKRQWEAEGGPEWEETVEDRDHCDLDQADDAHKGRGRSRSVATARASPPGRHSCPAELPSKSRSTRKRTLTSHKSHSSLGRLLCFC